ncbi:enoyl-CoA hydratase/isomerase family protein [Verticiella alkaliphila]|uniref:enoyl-CoA hydratase/isomerase family protein n=1 Tax=Verticiella alkaliphila TaxID=2779529 RepID=UPI00209B7116|nr:enoyl-CoA hydratase-related protein [Verticiella sp. GG226]
MRDDPDATAQRERGSVSEMRGRPRARHGSARGGRFGLGDRIAGAAFFVAQKATHDLFRNIEEFEKPTLAAINGVALGGGLELAMCCDLRVAAEHAEFGLPELRLGVIPAAGGTQRLPRLIGEARAKALMFTAAKINAAQALSHGLVTQVVPGGELLTTVLALADQIAEMPPLAVRFAKRAVNRGMQTDLDSGLEYERYAAAMLIDSEDRKEGMRAFVEKRKPVFVGR